MAVWQFRSKKKPSGSRYKNFSKKRKKSLGKQAGLTRIGLTKVKKIRTLGGNTKLRALKQNIAYVTDKEKQETFKTEILDVEVNPSSRHYARMNIITKGAIIKTKKGKAKVTSRPGQNGIVQAVKIKE